MITVRDSLKLGFIKFKTHRVRSVLSVVMFALGVVSILIFLLGVNSIRSILWEAYPDRYRTYFAAVNWSMPALREIKNANSTENIDIDASIPSVSEFKSIYSDKYEIKNVYKKTVLVDSAVTLKDFERKDDSNDSRRSSVENNYSYSIVSIDPYLSMESVSGGYSFENRYNGRIPILLNPVYADVILLNNELQNFFMQDRNFQAFDANFNEKLHEIHKNLHKYVGQEVTVSVGLNGSEVLSFQGLIVGYAGSIQPFQIGGDLFGLNQSTGGLVGIIIPEWALSVNTQIGRLFSQANKQDIVYIVEFDSTEKRDVFVDDMVNLQSPNVLSPSGRCGSNDVRCFVPPTSNEEEFTIPDDGFTDDTINSKNFYFYVYPLKSVKEYFEGILSTIQYLVICLASVFLTFGMAFVTINVLKILADSRKEVGIFRAVGAQQGDIVKIFMSYVFIILNCGFFVGLILAVITNIFLSLFFGDAIYYSIVASSSQVYLVKPLFVFVGFPYVELSVFYIILMVTGFLAGIFPILFKSRDSIIKSLRSE